MEKAKKIIEEAFASHERVSLLYSGGKDSCALLLLCEPYWDRLDLVFINTGDQFPEVLLHMEKIKKLVPSFTTLHSNHPAYLKEFGFPVDVLPDIATFWGQKYFEGSKLRFCSRIECCSKNMWEAATAYFVYHRPSCVFRGDKSIERLRGVDKALGIDFVYPLWDVPSETCRQIIKDSKYNLWEPRFDLDVCSSLDCQTCMGNSKMAKQRAKYLEKYHPELAQLQKTVLTEYKRIVLGELDKLGLGD